MDFLKLYQSSVLLEHLPSMSYTIINNIAVGMLQMSLESRVDGAEQSAGRMKTQVEDLSRQVNDLSSLKSRLTQENFDIQHRVKELDSSNTALSKAKNHLQNQNDDLKRSLDDEIRVSLLVRL